MDDEPPVVRAQFSTIQFTIIRKSAGFDSERNCVSVIQKIEKLVDGIWTAVDEAVSTMVAGLVDVAVVVFVAVVIIVAVEIAVTVAVSVSIWGAGRLPSVRTLAPAKLVVATAVTATVRAVHLRKRRLEKTIFCQISLVAPIIGHQGRSSDLPMGPAAVGRHQEGGGNAGRRLDKKWDGLREKPGPTP